MTHVKLPAGYEDWTSPGNAPLRVPYLRITAERIDIPHTEGEVVAVHWLMPPKPKPVLPDVKPGAVLSYRDKQGRRVRAVYPSSRLWNVYHQPHTPLNTACHMMVMSESQILADVNADGFTVELDGL